MAARKQTDLAVVEEQQPQAIQNTQEPQQSPLVNVLNVLVQRPELDIDKIERMIVMQRDVEANEARKAFAADFAAMQPALPIIERRGKSHHGAYGLWEDIVDEVMPVLGRHGFSLSFKVKPMDGCVEVTAILRHRLGHEDHNSYPFPLDTSGNKTPVQVIGSTTSYGKRYTGCAILNIVTRGEDSDGNTPITEAQQEELKRLLSSIDGKHDRLLRIAKADSYETIPSSKYDELVKRLKAQGAK